MKMAELNRSVVVPQEGSNYATWKIQCRMALIKDDLWNIVDGTETAPTEADKLIKFKSYQEALVFDITKA